MNVSNVHASNIPSQKTKESTLQEKSIKNTMRFYNELRFLMKEYMRPRKKLIEEDIDGEKFLKQVIFNGDPNDHESYGIIHYVNLLNGNCGALDYTRFMSFTIDELFQLKNILLIIQQTFQQYGFIYNVIKCLIFKIIMEENRDNAGRGQQIDCLDYLNVILNSGDINDIKQKIKTQSQMTLNKCIEYDVLKNFKELDQQFNPTYHPNADYVKSYATNKAKYSEQIENLKRRIKWRKSHADKEKQLTDRLINHKLELINELRDAMKLYDFIAKDLLKAVVINGNLDTPNYYGIINYVNVLSGGCKTWRDYANFSDLTDNELMALKKILFRPNDNPKMQCLPIYNIVKCLIYKIKNIDPLHSNQISTLKNTQSPNDDLQSTIEPFDFIADILKTENLKEIIRKIEKISTKNYISVMHYNITDKDMYYPLDEQYVSEYEIKFKKIEIQKTLNILKKEMNPTKSRVWFIIVGVIILLTIVVFFVYKFCFKK
jgi:hypothetical protein